MAAHKPHLSPITSTTITTTITRLSIAFVRYRLRTNCEFAKEAMQNQALDGEECLNLKWAYDDPNPKAQEAIKCVTVAAASCVGVSFCSIGFV